MHSCQLSTRMLSRSRVQPLRVFDRPARYYYGRQRDRVNVFVCRGSSSKYEFEEEELELLSSMEVDALRMSMDEAVEHELYEKAAFLRDMIIEKENEDPLLSLERDLEVAVKEERYEDAAKLRDQIEEIRPPPPPAPVEDDGVRGKSLSTCYSSATTEGVEVTVQSIYVPQHSSSAQGFMFAYKITITNKSHPTTIKLIARKWTITDAKGRIKVVEGSGVVGEQPELAPGESFTYQSVCPMETSQGSMKGQFEMYSRASPTTSWNTSFLVEVAEFSLDAEGPRFFE